MHVRVSLLESSMQKPMKKIEKLHTSSPSIPLAAEKFLEKKFRDSTME